MLRLWDALVSCAAMLGIVIGALGVMLQIVEPAEGMRRIGAVVGCAVLLVILPSIIAGIWSGLIIWHKICILSLVWIVVLVLGARSHQHRARPKGRDTRARS